MNKTLSNLVTAFVGESQARNRYAFYAKVAKKEGFEQVASIFLETAEQEKTHAKRLFEHIQEFQPLPDTIAEINIGKDGFTYKDTVTNLKTAIAGENHEQSQMYPEFAKIAREEGYDKIATRLESIAKAEVHHEERYIKLLEQVEAGTVFEKNEEVIWFCRECGYMHKGKTPPKVCPACDHAQAYYQLENEKY
jgi:rubrerythrin